MLTEPGASKNLLYENAPDRSNWLSHKAGSWISVEMTSEIDVFVCEEV